jgi:hypothetical protein
MRRIKSCKEKVYVVCSWKKESKEMTIENIYYCQNSAHRRKLRLLKDDEVKKQYSLVTVLKFKIKDSSWSFKVED